MFPFALIDDAVLQIEKAADAVVASADAVLFEDVKFPVSMDVPDRALVNAMRDADGIKFSADEYAFKQQTSDNDVSLECWSEQELAQKFITDENAGNRVRKLTLVLNRIGGAQGILTAKIFTDVSNAPGSSLGSSDSVNIATISAKGNITFTFPNDVVLAKNTPYWIVLSSNAVSSCKVVWYCKTSGPDENYPAAVKASGGAWTNHPDKNMTYILLGYYTTASVELPVRLAVGPNYQAAYFQAATDENSSITLSVKNANTGEILYTDLTDGQAVALSPSSTPNLKIIANLIRDPGKILINPVLSALGFSGTAYQSKYQFVDREFRSTSYSRHTVGMGLERTSGGLRLLSSKGTLKANSGPGYLDAGAMIAGNIDQKLTQLYYTDTAITITGFRMRLWGTVYMMDGGVWLDNAGVPGTLQGSLKETESLDGSPTWRVVTFDIPVDIPAGTYFHVGVRSKAAGAYYAAYYSYPLGGLHVTSGAGLIHRMISYAMDLYGNCAEASVISELILPGVKEHGLVYPLAYLPDGAGVSMTISDPLTGMPFHTSGTGEKCSLALLPTELFNRIKMATTLTQDLGSPGPVVGLCYTYTGAEMSPEPQRKYKITTYTFGALAAIGNYLTIQGRGKVLAMSVSGSTPSSNPGDGHKLTLDENVVHLRFQNVTSKTWAYLDTDFSFKTTLGASPPLGFEFGEKLSWDLTEYNGNSNGGSITVALEV